MRGSNEPAFSGYQILNKIVRDNVFGIYLHGDGAATTLARRNLLDGNNRPGSASGNGIYSDQGALGITVRANSSGITSMPASSSRRPVRSKRASSSRTTEA